MPDSAARVPEKRFGQLNDSLIKQRLSNGVQELGLNLPAPVTDRLLAYIALLHQWNRRINLTAVRTPLAMVARHILDSLAVSPFINGQRCLDVGSGAGLPGMILAISHPEQHWYLLDGNGKKIRFLTQAVIELQLDNVEVIESRLAAYLPSQEFSTIVCRAYAPLADYVTSVSHLMAANPRILAMKGALPDEEIQALRAIHLDYHIQPLTIPGMDAARNLVMIDPGQ